MFDVELLKNIKSLEADIQRQENTAAKNDIYGLKLAKLKADLNSMKGSYFNFRAIFNLILKCCFFLVFVDLFVKSAQNRQIAMAQIKSPQSHVTETNLIDLSPAKSLPQTKEETDAERGERRKGKRQIERKYSIKELFDTEKDFYTELSYCYEAFMANNDNVKQTLINFKALQTLLRFKLLKPAEFDKVALFQELKLVLTFSNHLISLLETELSSNNDEEIKIGACLSESSDDMKLVYAKYLQNHPNVAAIIKNVIGN